MTKAQKEMEIVRLLGEIEDLESELPDNEYNEITHIEPILDKEIEEIENKIQILKDKIEYLGKVKL